MGTDRPFISRYTPATRLSRALQGSRVGPVRSPATDVKARNTRRRFLRAHLEGLKRSLAGLDLSAVERLLDILEEAYTQGKTVFLVGNGGSAATASHMASDLAKTVLGKRHDRITKRFRAVALNDNVPLMTAWANDERYETIFGEQLKNLARRGDVLIVITGSGNSENIVYAVKTGRALGVTTVGLLGFNGGRTKPLLDHYVLVKTRQYAYVEDVHLVLNHLITDYFSHRLSLA